MRRKKREEPEVLSQIEVEEAANNSDDAMKKQFDGAFEPDQSKQQQESDINNQLLVDDSDVNLLLKFGCTSGH